MAILRTVAAVLCAVALAACGLQGTSVASAARIGAMLPDQDGRRAPPAAGILVDTAADLIDVTSGSRTLASAAVDAPGLQEPTVSLREALGDMNKLKQKSKIPCVLFPNSLISRMYRMHAQVSR